MSYATRSIKVAAIGLLLLFVMLVPASTMADEGGGDQGNRGTIRHPSAGEAAPAADSGGQGDEEGHLAPGLNAFRTWTLRGGYVAGGTSMRNLGKGNIKIKGIPGGSNVQAAYLYWNIIAPSQRSAHLRGMFNGVNITGVRIGSTEQPCWLSGAKSRSYRADVTSLVKGNGTYKLRNFASGITDGSDPFSSPVTPPLLGGASLVVVYSQSRYPSTTILLYNGAAETPTSVATRRTMMGPFPRYDSYVAYTTFIGADGQSNGDENAFFNGVNLPQADWDGTDPKIGGGSYANGNLWDTDTASVRNTAKRGISVGAFISPGDNAAAVELNGLADCLVHVAQVLSISNGNLDTDGDELRDGWEANGYDHNADHAVDVDLPAMGANPFHKDIFMEIDWMSSGGDNHHRPNDTVVNALVTAFKKGNVVNPDRRRGVGLHIDRSNSIAHAQDLDPGNCNAIFANMESIKTANMAAARYVTHHYQLWVHDLCPNFGSQSGIAQGIPGDDSIVSLGSWSSEGTTAARTGTSMHELGHSLNLRHGFPTGSRAGNGGPNDPYTPNHLSVMSYLYQTVGLIKNGSFGTWDYQRWNLPALNENCLNENKGVGSGSFLNKYGLKWIFYAQSVDTFFTGQDLTSGSANGPVNWNFAAGNNESCLKLSINFDKDKETLRATKKEWTRIVYDGGAVGAGTIGGVTIDVSPSSSELVVPKNVDELTYEQFLEMENLLKD